jgi:hypothetical protein
MITMQQWMELVDYKITEGSDYCWDCYGPNAYCLDSWNGVHGKGGYSFTIIFSTKTQKVYEIFICDYTNNRAYRMIAENKRDKHREESIARGINLNEAWDDIEYVELDVDEDFIEKAQAIKAGKDYDTSVMMNLELPHDIIVQAALAAHKKDITLNDYINLALTNLVNKIKSGEVTKETAKQLKVNEPIVSYEIIGDADC